jgi:hypothetical protein
MLISRDQGSRRCSHRETIWCSPCDEIGLARAASEVLPLPLGERRRPGRSALVSSTVAPDRHRRQLISDCPRGGRAASGCKQPSTARQRRCRYFANKSILHNPYAFLNNSTVADRLLCGSGVHAPAAAAAMANMAPERERDRPARPEGLISGPHWAVQPVGPVLVSSLCRAPCGLS